MPGTDVAAPTSAYAVRPAILNDAGSIARIYNEAVRTTTATFDTSPRSVQVQREWIEAHRGRFPVWVGQSGRAVVGWAALSPWSDRPAYQSTAEESIYVDAAHRGRGVGRALLGALLRAALDQHFHTILARIAEPNPPSTALHRRFGFEPVGTMREVGFKFDRLIDVSLWQRMLGPAPAEDQA